MANAGKVGRNSTLGSSLVILLLVAVIVAIVAYIILNPEIIDNLVYVAFIVIIAIVIIAVIIYVVMMILAIPYYAMKGEKYQTDSTYDLDDVEPVKEKDSREKED